MENKVKVLVVGAAFSAGLHAEAYSRCRDIADITGFCDKKTELIDPLAKEYHFSGYQKFDDYKTAIDQADCDVVDICLPNFLHHEVAMYAFSKGKHVVCEKPLATTVEDAEEMVAAAKNAGKTLFYAEDWLFAPSIVRALEILEEGAIGKPLFIRAREAHSGSHSPFAQTIKFCGGGCMIHLGIHPIGLVMAMKENKWRSLSAEVSGGGEKNLVHKKMEGEDWASCTITFEDGTTAALEANYITMGGMEDVVDIYGTAGCLHVDINFSSAVRCFSVPGVSYTVEKAEVTTGWSGPAVDEKYNLGYVSEIRHFMECVLEGREAKIGLRGIDGLENMRIVEAVYRSARLGKTVYRGEKQED